MPSDGAEDGIAIDHERLSVWCKTHFRTGTPVEMNSVVVPSFGHVVRLFSTITKCACAEDSVWAVTITRSDARESVVAGCRELFDLAAASGGRGVSYQVYDNAARACTHAVLLSQAAERYSTPEALRDHCRLIRYGRLRYQDDSHITLAAQQWHASVRIPARGGGVLHRICVVARERSDFLYARQMLRRLEECTVATAGPVHTEVCVLLLHEQGTPAEGTWESLSFGFRPVHRTSVALLGATVGPLTDDQVRRLRRLVADAAESTVRTTVVRGDTFWSDDALSSLADAHACTPPVEVHRTAHGDTIAVSYNHTTAGGASAGISEVELRELHCGFDRHPGPHVGNSTGAPAAQTSSRGNDVSTRLHADCIVYPAAPAHERGVCIYTVVTGAYEGGQTRNLNCGRHFRGCEFFYYTDSSADAKRCISWGCLPMYIFADGTTPKSAQRHAKVLPHAYIPPSYRLSIYVDGNAQLLFDHVDDYLHRLDDDLGARGARVVCYTHPHHKHILEERDAVVALSLESDANARAALEYVSQSAITPSAVAVSETNVLVRAHGEIVQFSSDWAHCVRMCKRDQISFDCLLEKHAVRYSRLPHDEKPIRKFPHVNPAGRFV